MIFAVVDLPCTALCALAAIRTVERPAPGAFKRSLPLTLVNTHLEQGPQTICRQCALRL